jgi:Asp-tRNA(Asn)/Glu-tRNA(Gln) amidotransferase A subunit family amidase
MNTNKPFEYSAEEARRALADRLFSCLELANSCLDRIDEREPTVGAWTFLDRDQLQAQARQADQRAEQAHDELPPLNGIPVGIKDIFDTCDMPTENGTAAHRGRRPEKDATVVDLLRRAGAIIFGKTVTAELAVYTPGKTTNPLDSSRTPGGSSSGSAAAVAAGMVPLALGTQTNGSVIRPAAYCGVVGFKPTSGTIPRAGTLRQAPSLDQIGVFSRTVFDSALLVSVLQGVGRGYGDILPWPKIDLDRVRKEPLKAPRFAFVKTAVWPEASSDSRERFLAFVDQLPETVDEIVFPEIVDRATGCHRLIMLTEMAHHYRELHQRFYQCLSPKLLEMLEEGRSISINDYLDAKNEAVTISGIVDAVLEPYDGVLCLSTPSEAPVGLSSTGSPIFCTLWSLCGVPAISVPLLAASSNLPIGLQVVGSRGRDTDVVKAAQWLERKQIR